MRKTSAVHGMISRISWSEGYSLASLKLLLLSARVEWLGRLAAGVPLVPRCAPLLSTYITVRGKCEKKMKDMRGARKFYWNMLMRFAHARMSALAKRLYKFIARNEDTKHSLTPAQAHIIATGLFDSHAEKLNEAIEIAEIGLKNVVPETPPHQFGLLHAIIMRSLVEQGKSEEAKVHHAEAKRFAEAAAAGNEYEQAQAESIERDLQKVRDRRPDFNV